MGKDEKPKKKGGAEKKKRFGKKAAPETYEADKRRITDFCERPENRDLESVYKLTKRVCETLGFDDKSFNAVKGYINKSILGPASGKAASNKPKEPANDWLATSKLEFQNQYGFTVTGDGESNMAKIWGHRERAAERNPGKTANNYAEWTSNYAAAKQADANLDTALEEYRKEKIKEWNVKHGWTDGVKPAVDLAELEKPKELRSGSPVLAEPALSATCAKWTTDGAAALAELVEQEETTLTRSKAHDPTWERIAARVKAEVAGAEYTAKQCAVKAYNLGLLATAEERLPPFRPYFPGARPPLDLTGLRKDIKRGDKARPELAELTRKALRYLCGYVFNVGIYDIEGDKEALIDALATAGMPACDPNDFGAEVPRVATPAFAKALRASVASHCAVEQSVDAAERALGPPDQALPKTGATVISGTDNAARARLARKEVLKHYSETYRPEPGDFPPSRANGEVIKNKVTVAYTPHTVFDPRQDCRVCGRLFLDCGGRVFCADRCWGLRPGQGFRDAHVPLVELPAGEHDHHAVAGLLATRHNGACLRCNIGWIRAFDELGLMHRGGAGNSGALNMDGFWGDRRPAVLIATVAT